MNEETLQLRSCADCKHRRTCCGVRYYRDADALRCVVMVLKLNFT